MYVCVCLAVTEADVEAAIKGGAVTREAVTRACRAGGDCGACHGMIEQKIEDHVDAQVVSGCSVRSPSHPPAPPGPPLVAAEALSRARGRAA
jgi:bacterioferritin-associated ferredoxin